MWGGELLGSGKWGVCHILLRCGHGCLPSFVIIIKYNFVGGWVGGAVSPTHLPLCLFERAE